MKTVYHLAQRRRSHVVIILASMDPASVPDWQVRAVIAWVRDQNREGDRVSGALSVAWRRLLKLPATSADSPFGLVVLDRYDDEQRAALDHTAAATALWLTATPAHLLANGFTPVAEAAASNRLQIIDLTDKCSDITEASEVILGDGPLSFVRPLDEVLISANPTNALWPVHGLKRDQEIARRLVPIIERDGAFEAIVAMGPHHPVVRRVRSLREARLTADAYLAHAQPNALPVDARQRQAWLKREVKRRSKSLAVSLGCAERLVAIDYGVITLTDLL